jgi:glycosyltransferase involved in cell wall biosynthesis
MPPLRVAHIIGALDYGGVENMALLLLLRLPPDQFHHDMIYIGKTAPQRGPEFRRASQRFEQIPYRRLTWPAFIWRLGQFFKEKRTEVVLCHNYGHHPWIGWAAKRAGVRRIYTIVASSPAVTPIARWKNRLKGWLGQATCTLEVAVSPQVALELQQEIGLSPQRIRTIQNCCLIDEIAQRARKARERTGVRSQDSSPLTAHPSSVLMVARLEEAKDHDTLIRAVAELRPSGVNVHLRLAGEGPRRSELEELVCTLQLTDKVEFLGVRHDIPELLGESDVFVLASKTEGLSIALIEAMSAGTPVISTDLPSCRDVLQGGRCGLLVPAGDSHALADAIRQLLDIPSLAQSLVTAATRRVQECYDPQITIDQYAQLLRGELD